MKPAHALSLIETAYRLDLGTQDWLQRIAAAASLALDSKHGAMAFRYDASGGDWVNSGIPALHGLSPEFARDFFNQEDAPPEAGAAMAQVFLKVRFGSSREVFERLQATTVCAVFDRYGIEDMVGVNGLDPTGRGCMLAIADRRRAYPARLVQLWHRLAAHISAGNRLRSTLEGLASNSADVLNGAEAVLAPNGKVEHAKGLAEPRSAREALRDALVRIDAARSESNDARRSVELWRGLVAGRWSLVEHFERDGKRYYLAHKNDPQLVEDRALTRRERLVLGYAELGHSNKLISYALGLASSTVSTLLARARRKVGIQP
jgi:DNA-binding CsgD family transcriptional regulator